MSESDFMDITRNGELCNANGEIGQREFQAIMRREVPLLLLALHADAVTQETCLKRWHGVDSCDLRGHGLFGCCKRCVCIGARAWLLLQNS